MFTHGEYEQWKKLKESEDIEFDEFLEDWRESNQDSDKKVDSKGEDIMNITRRFF